MAAGSALALLAPWPAALATGVAAWVLLRRGRRAMVAFASIAVVLQALLFGLFVGQGVAFTLPVGDLGSLRFWPQGAMLGALGALRLASVLAVNLATLSRTPAPRIVEGLGLPSRTRMFVAAVLIAMQDLVDEARRLREARQLTGAWPAGWRRIGAAAGLVAPLLVAGLHRGRTRQDALRLAGYDVPSWFAPIVAVTALGAAGRLLFAAVPNVSPTYVFVFLAGVLFGAAIGFWGGALSMLVSDFLLTGLLPTAFVNVPAMGCLGLLGALLRGQAFQDRGGRVLAAAIGLVATIVFSLVSDATTWLMVPEYQGRLDVLRTLVMAGLAFNVVAAVANAILFAAAVPATVHAMRPRDRFARVGSPRAPA